MGSLFVAMLETRKEPIMSVEGNKLVEIKKEEHIPKKRYVDTVNSLAESIKRYNEEKEHT